MNAALLPRDAPTGEEVRLLREAYVVLVGCLVKLVDEVLVNFLFNRLASKRRSNMTTGISRSA